MQERRAAEWYSELRVQMVDVSEAFVGIGKILVSGHALYRYLEDVHRIPTEKLPMSLIRELIAELSYNLEVSGFKESFVVMFRDEEAAESAERSVCARECVSLLSAAKVMKSVWFDSSRGQEFLRFVREEHICLALGHSDERSLEFLNRMLGYSLYGGVLSKESFRPPRIFMYVLDPSMHRYVREQGREQSGAAGSAGDSGSRGGGIKIGDKGMPGERAYGNGNSAEREIEDEIRKILRNILGKHYSEEKIEKIEEILSKEEGLKYYREYKSADRSTEQKALAEIACEILSAVQRTEEFAISGIFDGVVYSLEIEQIEAGSNGAGSSLAGHIETEQGESNQTVEEAGELDLSNPQNDLFIPTTAAHARFYNKEQEKTVRTEQMYIESLKKTAQSLHEGKHLHNPIGLVTEKTAEKKKKPETKEKLSKKQLEIIERNTKEKEIESKRKEVEFLRSYLSKYKAFSAAHEKRRHLESFFPRIHSPFICSKVLLLRVEFYLELWSLEKRKKKPNEKDLVSLYIDTTQFIEKYSQVGTQKELEYVVQTLIDLGFASTALEMCDKYEIGYTNRNDAQRTVAFEGKEPLDLSFDPRATKDPNDFDISFLMRSAGDKLKRTLNSRPDPRVLFEPDEWQIELLDIVDRGESAVICAPTSSGKTFICYYAMEKVLRESNENIVVFVAPTKALVNQVAADVYARFGSKPYVKQSNILQGICMSDFQISPFSCQILITVPGVLEKILTMPPETKKREKPYLERIKYIVIDEVHKISDSQMGVSMEKIIHFSPCAILLLSATLGNLSEFYGWVREIERKKNRECSLVEHRERFCEIKNFVFVPKKLERLESCRKSTREAGDPALAPVNSLFAYSFRGIKEEGFSDDVSFLPEELLNLYYAIFAVLRKEQRHLVRDFRPQSFFKTNCITKKDVKEYERYTISKFREAIQKGLLEPEQVTKIYDILIRETKEGFERIKKDLDTKLEQMLEEGKYDKSGRDGESGGRDDDSDDAEISGSNGAEMSGSGGKKTREHGRSPPSLSTSMESLNESMLDLAVSREVEDAGGVERKSATHQQGKDSDKEGRGSKKEAPHSTGAAAAPQTGISSDILLYNVEYLLDNILDLVVELEAKNMLPCIVFNLERVVCNALAIRLSEDLERFEKLADPLLSKNDIRENEKILKEMKRTRDAALSVGKDAWIGESMVAEEMSNRKVDPNAKDPRFCFTDTTIASSGAYDLDEYARSLKKSGKIDGRLTQALYRGIGVHHSGTPKKYRNMVEILFRMKQLRVIFATETLALGINMPCRTAVFAGDSLLLDSMSFKQMAGRAGRRGYDTQGNVVFFGLPRQKIQSLITSYLPRIKGSNPYTSTLAVQAVKPTTRKEVVESFVRNPLMSLSYPTRSFEGAFGESGESFRRRLLDVQRRYLVRNGFLDSSVLREPGKSLSQISCSTDIPLNHVLYDPESFVFMRLIEEGVVESICRGLDKDEASVKIVHLIASIFEVLPVPLGSSMPALPPLDKLVEKRLRTYHSEGVLLSKKFMNEREKRLSEVLGETYFPRSSAFSFFTLQFLNTSKSSYILDYFTHYRIKEVLRNTGMGETALWLRLKGVSDLLEALLAYYKMYNATSISLVHIQHTQELFEERFEKMHA